MSTQTSSAPTYQKITFADALQLASPPTWAASIFPVLVGASLTLTQKNVQGQRLLFTSRGLLIFILMFFTAILLQSAVNVLNDYADFKKGTDTAENSVDLVDVPIINKNLNPKSALNVAFVYLGLAAVCGSSVVALTTYITLIMGLIGAATVGLYSLGPKPISYLPLGEFISGFVMGEIICNATYYAIAGKFNPLIVVWALPLFFTIATIMQTNNTCDIKRDIEAGRKTLPILLGKTRSGHVIALAQILALGIAGAYSINHSFPWGTLIMTLAVIVCARNIVTIYNFDYSYKTRPQAMQRIAKQAVLVNGFYFVAIVIGALL